MHVPLGLEHPSSDVETGFREMCVGEKRLLTVPHHGQGDRDLPLQNGHYQYIYIKSVHLFEKIISFLKNFENLVQVLVFYDFFLEI